MRRLLVMMMLLFPMAGMAGEALQQFDYRRIYELLYQFETLPPTSRNRLDFAVRLLDASGKAPSDLAVNIHYRSRRIPVPVNEFGLLDLPFSPQLANVNAPVVTNQPEGSVDLGFTMIIRQPAAGRALDVEWLLAGMQQADAVMRARARIAENLVPRAVGVTLKFSGDTRGRVIIHGESDDVEYRADDYNTVDIPLDEGSLPERIEVTDQPLVIFPLFED